MSLKNILSQIRKLKETEMINFQADSHGRPTERLNWLFQRTNNSLHHAAFDSDGYAIPGSHGDINTFLHSPKKMRNSVLLIN